MSDATNPQATSTAATATTTAPAAAEVKATGALSGVDAAASKEVAKTDAAASTTDAAKTGEQPKAEAKVEELALKFPEGVQVDKELLGKFSPLAKELGLNGDGAQKLVDLFVGHQQAAAKAIETAVAQQTADWKKQITDDKEFGGAKFAETVGLARKAIAKFAPEIRQELADLGLDDHPGLIRAFAKVGRAMAEDSLSGTSGAQASPADAEDRALSQRFPTMFPQS